MFLWQFRSRAKMFPFSYLDLSFLRAALLSTEHGEAAEFVVRMTSDDRGQALVKSWTDWIGSCPGPLSCVGECGPHYLVRHAVNFTNELAKKIHELARKAERQLPPKQMMIRFLPETLHIEKYQVEAATLLEEGSG